MPHRAPRRGNRIGGSVRRPRSSRSRCSRAPRCSPGTSRIRNSLPGHDPSPPSISPPSSPTGWSELPAPPEVRSGAATAWTGSQLLVWGGYEYVGGDEDPGADGFAFDAAAHRWQPLPPSPLEGRSGSAFAWTGQELLIWGGWDGGFRDPPFFGDGAAYDPVAGTWRMLPAAPIDARAAFSVWTGEELIVWGSTDRGARRLDGAAYNPATNAWRTIADAPTRHHRRVGGLDRRRDDRLRCRAGRQQPRRDADQRSGSPTTRTSDSWRELPPSDLSPQAMTPSWLDDELIAWDYDQASAAYDPIDDRLASLERVPLAFSECVPVERLRRLGSCSASSAAGRWCSRPRRTHGSRIPLDLRDSLVAAVGPPSRSQRAMWSSRCPGASATVSLETARPPDVRLQPTSRRSNRCERRGARPGAVLPRHRTRRRSPPDAGDLPRRVGSDARVSDRARTRSSSASSRMSSYTFRREVPGPHRVPPPSRAPRSLDIVEGREPVAPCHLI